MKRHQLLVKFDQKIDGLQTAVELKKPDRAEADDEPRSAAVHLCDGCLAVVTELNGIHVEGVHGAEVILPWIDPQIGLPHVEIAARSKRAGHAAVDFRPLDDAANTIFNGLDRGVERARAGQNPVFGIPLHLDEIRMILPARHFRVADGDLDRAELVEKIALEHQTTQTG